METIYLKEYNMKVFSRILSLVSVLVLFFTGCQEYDDTEIKGRVDNLESQVTELRLLVEKSTAT